MKSPGYLGKCRLCDAYGPLVASHLFPAFIYKLFVSDHRKGGSFVDLPNKCVATRQLTFPWLCARCDNEVLGGWEGVARPFLDRCMADPHSPQAYGEGVHRFAVSFAWRAGLLHMAQSDSQAARDLLRTPLRTWKAYLSGYGADVRPFSVHAFLVIGGTFDVHKATGTEFVERSGFLFSQLGPLFVLGMLDRSRLELHEIDVWERSELRPRGGVITPVSDWKVNQEIPRTAFDQFRLHVARTINAAEEMRLLNRI